MADASFDVVSKVDRQEVDNALNQASKELSQRFDFRGTGTSIAWAGDEANDRRIVRALVDSSAVTVTGLGTDGHLHADMTGMAPEGKLP